MEEIVCEGQTNYLNTLLIYPKEGQKNENDNKAVKCNYFTQY